MTKQFLHLATNFLISIGIVSLVSCRGNIQNNASKHGRDSLEVYKEIYSRGQITFEKNCKGCHLFPHGHPEGGGLRKFFSQLPQDTLDYFSAFIKDSKKLKTNGDPFAIRIAKEYASDYEHQFQDSLTDQQINDLLLFIWLESKSKT